MRSFFHLTDNLKKLFRGNGLNSKFTNSFEIAYIVRHNIFAFCGYSQFKHKFITCI